MEKDYTTIEADDLAWQFLEVAEVLVDLGADDLANSIIIWSKHFDKLASREEK